MKNKHQQVVDLSNPNEGQGISASTSAFKIRHNMSKQTSIERLESQLMKDEHFIKVYCSQELPKEIGESHLTDIGNATYWGKNAWVGFSQDMPTWWLKPIDLEQVKSDAWDEGNQITEKYWQDYDENGGNEYPTNPYKNEEQ
jgi:hypothetical protein